MQHGQDIRINKFIYFTYIIHLRIDQLIIQQSILRISHIERQIIESSRRIYIRFLC